VREAQRKALARLPAALALPAASASDAAAEIVLHYAKKKADAARTASA
jgi:hypothetical protein